MEPSLFEGSGGGEPLASRLRPRTLDQFVGQRHLLDPGKPLRQAIERGDVPSLIFWGPPGSGKTTLASLIARHTDKHFEPFSAVTEGVPRVREIIREARERRRLEGRGTILFCDEIHRFNRAQQDAFLPSVEEAVITLIGATTENPSFELTGALLSRCQVYLLEPLSADDLRVICQRCAASCELAIDAAALDALVRHADGDARRAINTMEAVSDHLAGPGTPAGRSPVAVSLGDIEAVLSRRLPRYDKSGDEHFNLISALHKAVRGSDVDGALYWLARMLDAGEDPLYLTRRVVRMAVEDIGLADPRALSVALAAKEAFHFLGSPEGDLAIAQAVVYLATAPKSNRVYQAWGRALGAAHDHPAEPVPLHLRNAPTPLMKGLGYGAGYRYDHDEAEALAAGQEYLPEPLRGARWYEPTDRGFEKTIRERLQWWRELRRKNE